jgi:hypothetical protein
MKSIKDRIRHREYCKDHYRRNKKRYVAKSMKRHQMLKAELNAIKEKTPCKDCKRRYPACVMEYDHVKGKKKFDISYGYYNYGKKTVEKELKKCELVCANCHRIRTQNRIPR